MSTRARPHIRISLCCFLFLTNATRDKSRLPIVTLPFPGARIYLVFSVPVIQAVQKQVKTLAFQPIQVQFSVQLCGASKEAKRILEEEMDMEVGRFGNIFTAMHNALNPGRHQDALNLAMMEHVYESVEQLGQTLGVDVGSEQKRAGQMEISLFKWLRHHVTLATTNSVYGSHNPFRDEKVENAFWYHLLSPNYTS